MAECSAERLGGVTWGVPWEIGALQKDDPISITVPDQPAPFLQSWPLAYWPDGSVKWTGHAAVFKEGSGGRVLLQKEDRKRLNAFFNSAKGKQHHRQYRSDGLQT